MDADDAALPVSPPPAATGGGTPGLVAALVGLGLLWGATIPLSKIAVSGGHRPLGLIFWQLAFSTLLLLLAGGLRRLSGRRQTSSAGRQVRPDLRYLPHFLIVSLLGTLLPNTFSYLSLAQLPAGIMAIIIASVPMFALLFALLLRLERYALARIAGVLLGAAAVLALIGPDASLPDPAKAPFVLLALIGPACYGLEGCYLVRYARPELGPAATLLGASALGALIVAPLALVSDSWVDLFVPWSAPEWALLLASALHVVAYTGYIWLVGQAGAVFSSQIAYVVTIAGVLLSALTLNERYSGWVWAALGLMLAGLALVQPRR